MRTVEQVAADLKRAEEAERAAANVTGKFRSEMQAIYQASRDALGIKELDPFAFK